MHNFHHIKFQIVRQKILELDIFKLCKKMLINTCRGRGGFNRSHGAAHYHMHTYQ